MLSQERTDQDETERRANLQSRAPADAMTRFTEVINVAYRARPEPEVSTQAAKSLPRRPLPGRVTVESGGKSMWEKTPCK